MSQSDWGTLDPDTQGGTDLASKLNPWIAAVLSFHRGSAAPSYVVTGMEWQKDVSSTVAERYVYDGAQSLLLYTINPTAHTVLVPAANLPAASDTVKGAVELATNAEFLGGTSTSVVVTPDNAAALWEKGTDNTGGATITLGDGGSFNLITSTTAITAFAFTTDKAGRRAKIRFNTARTLTHDGSALIIPGGANIATAAGDIAEIESLGSGNFRVNEYTRAAERPLKTGTAANDVVRLDGSARLPPVDGSQLTGVSGGVVVQVVHVESGALVTGGGTTMLPADDTIPQNTEGSGEFISATITPTDSGNNLLIEAKVCLGCGTTVGSITAALFRDSTAGAIAGGIAVPGSTGVIHEITLRKLIAAGSTSATTFKIRAGGGDNPTTIYLNGAGAGRQLGGVLLSSITITEVTP